jgi:hypothetical protein
MQLVDFIDASAQLVLHLERHLQRCGRDCVEEELADGVVNARARDVLADPSRVFDSISLADVCRDLAALAAVVAHRHAVATDAAHDEPLQQCRSLAWRTLATVVSVGAGVVAQCLLVVLILLPGNVPRMRVEQDRVPLIAGQRRETHAPVWTAVLAVTTEDECASIAGVVQDLPRAIVRQRAPDQLSLSGTAARTTREEQLLVAECLDRSAR